MYKVFILNIYTNTQKRLEISFLSKTFFLKSCVTEEYFSFLCSISNLIGWKCTEEIYNLSEINFGAFCPIFEIKYWKQILKQTKEESFKGFYLTNNIIKYYKNTIKY